MVEAGRRAARQALADDGVRETLAAQQS
jgi:hypothetical protein